MQLDQLLYFIDLCESGSLTDSAKRFFISPQGFRKSIASLENDLGIRLVQVANHQRGHIHRRSLSGCAAFDSI